MYAVAESVPGEITLMFISYLVFCTVLIYLFVTADREWGRMEVALDNVGKRDGELMAASALSPSQSDMGPGWAYAEVNTGRSVHYCTEHHPLNCSCFLQGQHKGAD